MSCSALPQAINVAVSLAACAAIAISLGQGMNAVLGVFGIWAIVAGLLQLAAGVLGGKPLARNGR